VRQLAPLIRPWLQVLLTLFHRCFSHFNRSTCLLSVSCQYLGLRGIHLASSNNTLKLFYSLSSTGLGNKLRLRLKVRDYNPSKDGSFQTSRYSQRSTTFISMLPTPYIPRQRQACLPSTGLPCGSGIALLVSSIAFTETVDVSFLSSG
jgi:hypothetical protein